MLNYGNLSWYSWNFANFFNRPLKKILFVNRLLKRIANFFNWPQKKKITIFVNQSLKRITNLFNWSLKVTDFINRNRWKILRISSISWLKRSEFPQSIDEIGCEFPQSVDETGHEFPQSIDKIGREFPQSMILVDDY